MSAEDPTPIATPALIRALLEHLERTRQELRSAVERVPADHRDRAPEGRWSVTGIVEHLAITEERIGGLLRQHIEALPQAAVEDDGAATVPGPGPILDRRRRIEAREYVEPTGTLDAPTAWARLERSRAFLTPVVRSGAGRALHDVKLPHPALGAFDLVEWIAFIGYHEARHTDQIRELVREMGLTEDGDAAGWLTRVDHLVYAAPDLEHACDRLEALFGMRPVRGGRHARWGTHNALLAVGPRAYIEAIAPDPERSDAALPTLFGIDTLPAPRLVAWAAATRDFGEGAVLGAGEVLEGSRRRPDGSLLEWRMSDPETVAGDGLLPFLVDWGKSRHPAIDAPRAGTLTRLRATHPDASPIAQALASAGLPMAVANAKEPSLTATFDTLRGPVELT